MSGYTYKKKIPSEFFANKVKALLVPVILYQSINLLFYGILSVLGFKSVYSHISFGGFWFLLTLLYISIMYYAVDLLTERSENIAIKHIITVFSALFLLVLGLIYATRISDQQNQPIATAFVGYFFFVFGVYVGKWELYRKHALNRFICVGKGIVGAVLLLILVVTIRANSRTIDMNTSRYSIEWLFVVHALLGTVGTYLLALAVKTNKILEFFGRNTIIVLLIHIPVSKAVPFVLLYIGVPNWIVFVATTVSSIAISSCAIRLIDKYLPFMAGKIKWDELYANREA